MTQRQGSLNLQYAAVQGFYWMGICVCISFAAVFLQHRGYSNSALGFVMACGNIAGFLLSPVLAALVDRSQRVGVFSCLWALLLLQGLLLLFFRGTGPLRLLPGLLPVYGRRHSGQSYDYPVEPGAGKIRRADQLWRGPGHQAPSPLHPWPFCLAPSRSVLVRSCCL